MTQTIRLFSMTTLLLLLAACGGGGGKHPHHHGPVSERERWQALGYQDGLQKTP
ncbi:hypothetical protein [Gluconacetobacter azotocaptans]|uniref:hypothetical protein n=1 Tax=Gluconacetobacter azotocaptans TaxID=142834 RepID=UPI001F048E56|nr:hypothetical protein [Gluconacetobacter azotocaptans]